MQAINYSLILKNYKNFIFNNFNAKSKVYLNISSEKAITSSALTSKLQIHLKQSRI